MKKFMVVATAGVVILLGILLYLIKTEDKIGPIITFASTDLSYTEGGDTSELIKNVTAVDGVDGDVTASVIITSIIPMSNSATAKIIYAAKDSRNNVTIEDMIVNYIAAEEEVVEDTEEKGEGELQEEEAVATVSTASVENTQVKTEENSSVEVDADADADTSTQANSQANTEVNTKENMQANSGESKHEDILDKQTDTQEGIQDETAPLTNPRITLTTNEVILPLESDIDVMSYVKNIEDDKDSYYAMMKKVLVIGSYNMKKKGNYILLYYATDSDGNESNKESLWVKVE